MQHVGVLHFTFHKDNHHVKKLLEGEVTVSIFISEREHGVYEQGVGLEAESIGKLRRCQLALENLSGFLVGNATHVASVTLLNFQDL